MAEQTYKCAFKHCKHESCEVSRDCAIRINKRYFHKDCAEIYKNIEDIKALYYEKISNTVVVSNLMSVINNIIFKKGVDSNYFLFALKYAISTNRRINYPQGLHYIVDDYRIKKLWTKKQSQKIALEIKNAEDIDETKTEETQTFKFSVDKQGGFGSILKGGV